MATAKNIRVDLQSGTDTTVFATWEWTKNNTSNYSVVWYYNTGDGVWFIGNESTTTSKQSTYSAPSNANSVKFKVKPVAKTKKVNGKDVLYWTASWSSQIQYNFKSNPPSVPSVPTVSINQYVLTSEVDVYDPLATQIEFQVVQNNSSTFATNKSGIKTNHASYRCGLIPGSQYKVRCRSIGKTDVSAWSEYSSNITTIPDSIVGSILCYATSSTSVSLTIPQALYATSYEVEYTTNKNYFDTSNETQSITVSVNHAEITGLESGKEWFFRAKAINSQGETGWSYISSIILGKAPSAPTTWSLTTTAIVGDIIMLYWVHNSEDGSKQTNAQLELDVNGVVTTQNIAPTIVDGENSNNGSYPLVTSSYTDGVKIKWRIRTKGIINQYSDWSIQRSIDIYAPPVLTLTIGDGNLWYWDTFNFVIDTIYTADGTIDAITNVLLHFPYFIKMVSGPNTQQALSYTVSISSNESYETVDDIGNIKYINSGEVVYSSIIDRMDNDVTTYINANNIDLENNVTYTISCSVIMDSGLSAQASTTFIVNWSDEQYEPNAEIGYDENNYSAYIRPYCENLEGDAVENVLLSVYRREFDGTFTELATNMDGSGNTFITDPHPALDYGRYRIVAISKTTGAVSFYDVPGYPIGESSIIIQWNEEWSNFDSINEDREEKPTWTGSLLKLPYNIQVSDTHDSDASLIEYIGRKHPVSYYGTQLGETSTWNVDIIKSDEETLYAIRRLAIWMGDVYVREPSGSGYWARIKVSFSQKYNELTIPVTFDISRVDGGV